MGKNRIPLCNVHIYKNLSPGLVFPIAIWDPAQTHHYHEQDKSFTEDE